MTTEQRDLFQSQQQFLDGLQHPSAQSLLVTTLTFEPICPTVVRPSSADTVLVSIAPLADSTSVVTKAVTSLAQPTSSTPPSTTPVTPNVSSRQHM